MAAEYSAIPVQTICVDENVIFANGSRACHKGCIQHRDTSGIFFLKGATNGCKAVYRVTFDGNIAIATGGTVEPISVALTINGEALGNATAIVTPAAVDEYFNVTSTALITVPRGCCFTLSVRSVPATEDPTVTPAPVIELQNANLVINRVA